MQRDAVYQDLAGGGLTVWGGVHWSAVRAQERERWGVRARRASLRRGESWRLTANRRKVTLQPYGYAMRYSRIRYRSRRVREERVSARPSEASSDGPGSGSKFFVQLPLKAQPAQPHAA